MVAQDNSAIVRRFFDEMCNERKLDLADELFAVTASGFTALQAIESLRVGTFGTPCVSCSS